MQGHKDWLEIALVDLKSGFNFLYKIKYYYSGLLFSGY